MAMVTQPLIYVIDFEIMISLLQLPSAVLGEGLFTNRMDKLCLSLFLTSYAVDIGMYWFLIVLQCTTIASIILMWMLLATGCDELLIFSTVGLFPPVGVHIFTGEWGVRFLKTFAMIGVWFSHG